MRPSPWQKRPSSTSKSPRNGLRFPSSLPSPDTITEEALPLDKKNVAAILKLAKEAFAREKEAMEEISAAMQDLEA
jgi:hypothetical protein